MANDTTAPEIIWNGPGTAPATLILAHGAGAAMDSAFMNTMAEGLAQAGLRVARFEFPYMAQRRREGGRRPPDRQPALLERWWEVIEAVGPQAKLLIGGKSMGGRMASVDGLVCLGYPFHPPGRPERTRIDHLHHLRTPTLICQGERDPMGRKDEISGYRLPEIIRFCWLADGDHSFKPRKASGHTEKANLQDTTAAIEKFVRYLTDQRPNRPIESQKKD